MSIKYIGKDPDIVDLDSSQTLTNKTLTTPAINGIVTTTGLTLPAFTAGTINNTTIPTNKTLVDLDSTQTLSAKTLTSPTIDGGTWTLPSGTGSTTEGVIQWDTSTDTLTVGTGAATKFLVDTDDFDVLSPTTSKGDLIVYGDAAANIRLPVGTDTYILQADSSLAAGMKWTSFPTAEVTLAGTETLSNKTLTSTKFVNFVTEYDNGSVTGAVAINWSNGQQQKLTMTGNITALTFSFAGLGAGFYQLKVIQSNSTAYTITWSTNTPAAAYWLNNTAAPSLYTGATGRTTMFNFFWDGTICYGSGAKVDSY